MSASIRVSLYPIMQGTLRGFLHDYFISTGMWYVSPHRNWLTPCLSHSQIRLRPPVSESTFLLCLSHSARKTRQSDSSTSDSNTSRPCMYCVLGSTKTVMNPSNLMFSLQSSFTRIPVGYIISHIGIPWQLFRADCWSSSPASALYSILTLKPCHRR